MGGEADSILSFSFESDGHNIKKEYRYFKLSNRIVYDQIHDKMQSRCLEGMSKEIRASP